MQVRHMQVRHMQVTGGYGHMHVRGMHTGMGPHVRRGPGECITRKGGGCHNQAEARCEHQLLTHHCCKLSGELPAH